MMLVDIENFTGTPSPSTWDVTQAIQCLEGLVPSLGESHVVVACSHRAAPTVAFAWRAARHIWRSGPDGADLALLSVLANERVHERFESVTICSGDGIFADIAGWLGGAGVNVNVISLAGHLSTRLRIAAASVQEVAFPTVAATSGESA